MLNLLKLMNLFEQTFKKHVKLVNEHLNEMNNVAPISIDMDSKIYGDLQSHNPQTLERIKSLKPTAQTFSSFKNDIVSAYKNAQNNPENPEAESRFQNVYDSLGQRFGLNDQDESEILISGQGGTLEERMNDIKDWFALWGQNTFTF